MSKISKETSEYIGGKRGDVPKCNEHQNSKSYQPSGMKRASPA